MTEKCSVCSWHGEDVICTYLKISRKIAKKLDLRDHTAEGEMPFLTCPRCGGILQSELIQ